MAYLMRRRVALVTRYLLSDFRGHVSAASVAAMNAVMMPDVVLANSFDEKSTMHISRYLLA